MLRRSICALTVVTFAACADSRNGTQDAHSDGTTNTDLAEPTFKSGHGDVNSAPATTPAESADAAEGVGPGLIIIDTKPTIDPAPPAVPAEEPPPEASGQPADVRPR